MTKFDPHPFKVVRIKGTMIIATRNEKYVTRNSSLFKPLKVDEQEDDEDLSDSNDDIEFQNETFLQNSGNGGNVNPTRRYPVRERRPLQRYIEHY